MTTLRQGDRATHVGAPITASVILGGLLGMLPAAPGRSDPHTVLEDETADAAASTPRTGEPIPRHSTSDSNCRAVREHASALERDVAFLRGVAARRAAGSAATPVAWAQAVAPPWRPAEFERQINAALERRGLGPAVLECSNVPCLAQLPLATTDEDLQGIVEELDRVYGQERRYAYKGFFPAPETPQDATSGAALVLGYVPPGSDLDDERSQMLERAGTYTAALTDLSLAAASSDRD